MKLDLRGRSAVVTGAASGIGAALADLFLDAGATVFAADVDAEALRVKASAEKSVRLRPRTVDVRDREAVTALLEEADREAPLEWVVNNAGIVAGGPLLDMDDATVGRIVDVNLWGVLHGTRAGCELLRARGRGHLVNVASMAGLAAVPYSSVYAASKHAVVGLSLSVREEMLPHGVQVHVACPGVVKTGIFDSALDTPGFSYRRTMDRGSLGAISPQAAARGIIQRSLANDAIVVVPRPMRLFAWAARLLPGPIARGTAARMRRGESSARSRRGKRADDERLET